MSCSIRGLFCRANRKILLNEYFCHCHSFRSLGTFRRTGKSADHDWNKAVSDAEKVVGYPTSFLSLRCFLSDEFSNVAMHMRKLFGTKHPLLHTLRGLMYDVKHNMQTRGLIVLLISKAAGPGPTSVNAKEMQDMIGGIYPSQRSLAEIIEVIHLANLIHKGIVNVEDLVAFENSEKTDMEFGNKMAVLSGDFLLASASTELAKLRNTDVVEHISKAIGDQKEADFMDFIDDSGKNFLKSDVKHSDWLRQAFLSSGSLLARGCLSAMKLANHSEEYQNTAFKFGENMAYAKQINEDLKPFINPEKHLEQLSLTSLPVVKYMEKNNGGKELLCSPENFSCKKIYDQLSSTAYIKECQDICQEMGQNAKKSLEIFDSSEAKDSLLGMVDAVVTS